MKQMLSASGAAPGSSESISMQSIRPTLLWNAREFPVVERVVRILVGEGAQDGSRLLGMAVADGGDGEHHAGEGREIVALGGGDLEQPNAFFLAGLSAGDAE